MKRLVTFFVMLFALNSFVYASFPVTEPIERSSTTEITEPIVYGDSPWPNIVSLSCAVLSLVVPYYIGIPLLVCAVVFGAIGFNRSLKGLGIAGFVLGVLGVIGTITLLATDEADYEL